eukprot:c27399_g1_i1.p1 GENE.c27399_g1_i1~~c27399_g1_i1.p1  ORF type:complete len:511 (+),score=298.83 c27399_g1_i1:31-1533(+)
MSLSFGFVVRRSFANQSSFLIGRRGLSSNSPFDVVVIGGGPGGYVAAIKAAQLGLKTACVEGRGTLGGTCLNVGCIPSKALLQSSHMFEEAKHRFPKHGIVLGDISLDLGQVMKQKDSSVRGLTQGIEGLFKKNSVTYVKGWGSIPAPNQVSVASADGQTTVLSCKNIIIATGSDVTSIPNVKIDDSKFKIVSSTGALSLPSVPEKMVVIGGGVIGLEMGSVWKRFGSDVTVVEYLDRIVPSLDFEMAKQFQNILKKQGFNFKLGTKVTGVEERGSDSKMLVHTETVQGGSKETLEADVVLVSTGRRAFTDKLGLAALGVKTDKAGRVIVDHKTFQSNIPGVYAIGDVIDGPMLAHKAEEDGIACVEGIAGKGGHVNYDTVPGVIYTHPEVASVGKTEEQVKESGVKYNVGKFPFQANSRARTVGDSEGLVKVISSAVDDRILGIHIIGANAGELIGEAVLAMEYGASSEDIARTCHAHPTLSEAVKEAAMATYDKPIHF